MQEEIWKPIIGFEKYYEVSSLCNVRRLQESSKLKVKNLKMLIDKDGYHRVNLKVNQKSNSKYVHRLIAISFIPNPHNKPQVNHINGKKHDNRIENLEWCTLSENRVHAHKTGLQNGLSRRGNNSNFSKLTDKEVIEIRNRFKSEKISKKQLSIEFNVSASCISLIISKKNWSWL